MKQYLHEWDIPYTTEVVKVSGIPEKIVNMIWEEKREKGKFTVREMQRTVRRG